MSFFNKFETRLGRFAIPGLVQFIAILQLLTLVLFHLLDAQAKQSFLDFLLLKPDAVLRGEIWRLFTYVFIPRGSLLFAVIGAMFMMWLGRGLDEAWGAFRVNAYVFGGMMALAVGSLLFGYQADAMWLYLTLLFAFATIYPNEEIMAYFILPVKIKWLAWLAAGFLALNLIQHWILIVPTFFALLNYVVAFGPALVSGRLQAAKVSQRRERYEAASLPSAAFFHQCKVCGKTEIDDPSLEFRVTDEGEEICSVCRSAKA